MSILDNFPHTATATTRRRVTDTVGGSRDSFPTTVFSNRVCWRQPAGAKAIEEFAKRGISVTDKVYFLTDPGLDAKHVLTIDGDIYEVRSFSDPDAAAGLGTVYKVFCERTTTGSTP